MTGDEVLGTKIPRAFNGYDPGAVNNWLQDVASCLNAGVPPATFVPPPSFPTAIPGCDIGAVIQLSYALGFNDMPALQQAAPASGWRSVKERLASLGSWDERNRQRGRSQHVCDLEWFRVAGLPGTRVRWTSKGIRTERRMERGPLVLGTDGQVLVTGGENLTVCAAGREFRSLGPGSGLVNAATGRSVLWRIGAHQYLSGGSVVLFPERRWLRFPVQGTDYLNGVMRAVDESGTTLLWFRGVGQGEDVVEVVVSPEYDLTPETLCVLALAAPWLKRYFTRPSGGGGG